jgi:signal transduction histidine kinase
MRLKTKLVLAATGVTLLVVLVLAGFFLAELLRQRIEQAVAANDVLANQVRSATREALQSGLSQTLPGDNSEAALFASVATVLRKDDSLRLLMSSIVRYSLTVQDVSVTDSHGMTLVSTDPDALGQPAPFRTGLRQVSQGSLSYQWQRVFGAPRVLDIAAPLDRNGMPFLVVHIGVRSTFLKASFAPGLRDALIFASLAALALVVAAAVLTNIALRPLEAINTQLELLTAGAEDEASGPYELARGRPDTVVQVTKTIGRLERKMRSNEAGYTALQTNMEQMLDTLRDGVLLFATDRSKSGRKTEPGGEATGDLRAVMVSDAVEHFLAKTVESAPGVLSAQMIGRRVEEIFAPETALGAAILAAFQRGGNVSAEVVLLEDGRQVEISLDRIEDVSGTGGHIGTLVTLRDKESVLQLEHELEVSRRLAAIGRITAGVGHEVKNPINAMVLHLELLRGKLAAAENGTGANGAQRHVEILASEMQRLDRVVQTLADFSRPMEMHLKRVDLRAIVASVIELTWEQMRENKVTVQAEATREPMMVYVDSDLVRQALLNLVLNGMQSMADGGVVHILLRREQQLAVIEVKDSGIGIQEDLLPRIFDLYFTTKKTGSGIGLATTYRILQMHGGALDVRSTTVEHSPDHGSVFTMRLPISLMSSAARVDAANVSGTAEASLRGLP